MTRIFYIIEQEVIMAKLIGFSESIVSKVPIFCVNNLRELEQFKNLFGRTCYQMIQDAPNWLIGYQREIRYFLDDGTHIDFVNDCDGQIQFLKNYIANDSNTSLPQKLEIASEIEFMDI